MARIVNVIYKPHFATYKAYDNSDFRCCTMCDYKVIIEIDNGCLLVASILDEACLEEIELDELVEHLSKGGEDEDEYYPFNRAVRISDINNFINGFIEEGEEPLGALSRVLQDIRESGVRCTDEVKELINKIQL